MKVLHTRGREAGGQTTRKATAFHGSVSAAITNTQHTRDTVTGGSAAAPFLRGERRREGGTLSLFAPPRDAPPLWRRTGTKVGSDKLTVL